ncbi:hypothetical protein GCM10028801_30720 [Nocardioides maradonensis]
MFVRRLLGEQRKRAVASIMSAIDAQRLPEAQRKDLRSQVMASINQYHDTCLDILKSSVDVGFETNEAAVQAIVEFNRGIAEARQLMLDGRSDD